jgi:hypothetical protein
MRHAMPMLHHGGSSNKKPSNMSLFASHFIIVSAEVSCVQQARKNRP